MTRFSLLDETGFRAWLAATPRAIVLLRGVGCPYSATFERTFLEEAPPDGWSRGVREVEEGGNGPVAGALLVEVTPTLVAYEGGKERARLPGKLLVGITRAQYRRFLRGLA